MTEESRIYAEHALNRALQRAPVYALSFDGAQEDELRLAGRNPIAKSRPTSQLPTAKPPDAE